ncbi:hypothetical protein ACFL27_09375 [candidate division CSSED10-310 bacterium]|uniref:Teneurin-like YD-shell domain-containing protein n=1 Tax=candidate division CSSED10-310 bacterium TaxID=2855610 RepID=A0ABV6YW05_UNCC1
MPITYTYDTRGRVETISQGANRTYTLTYDSHGNLDTMTDPLSRTVSFDYDLAGRMTKQVMPDLREVNLTYDANGNIKTIQPPGRPSHEFNYTPVNLEEDYIPPDIGIGPPQTHYIYNLDRQLTQVQRPDGKNIDLFLCARERVAKTGLCPWACGHAPGWKNIWWKPDPG